LLHPGRLAEVEYLYERVHGLWSMSLAIACCAIAASPLADQKGPVTATVIKALMFSRAWRRRPGLSIGRETRQANRDARQSHAQDLRQGFARRS
jgi:hypothetical protein